MNPLGYAGPAFGTCPQRSFPHFHRSPGLMTAADTLSNARAVLLERFGHRDFRPGQAAIIETVLAGRDVLAVMPTGSGKSLCYQLPAVFRQGCALVISPLIALMKDQVDALQAQGIAATYVNSSLPPREQQERLQACRAGVYDLLYIAPERFRSARFVEAISRTRVSLFAIDEAHCISEWGARFSSRLPAPAGGPWRCRAGRRCWPSPLPQRWTCSRTSCSSWTARTCSPSCTASTATTWFTGCWP